MVHAAELPPIAPDTEPYHFASLDGDEWFEINGPVAEFGADAVREFLSRKPGRLRPLTFARRYLAMRQATFSVVE